MPSLVVTKNNGVPRYGDWANDSRRQQGQVIAGQQMLASFAVAGTDEKQIVLSTLQGCWNNDCSIWMKYDGDKPDSFAIIDELDDQDLDDTEIGMMPFISGIIHLKYYKVEPAQPDTPITKVGNSSKLSLQVQNDSPPGQTQNKRMNVVIPSDFADFEDQYLQDMTADIETISLAEDVPYLLSSLTFRRCL